MSGRLNLPLPGIVGILRDSSKGTKHDGYYCHFRGSLSGVLDLLHDDDDDDYHCYYNFVFKQRIF